MCDDPSDFDTTLRLCCDEHRRIVLATLASERRALSLNDLTNEIVTHNHHEPITDVSGEAVTHVYLSLYHEHVPLLVEASVIEYDRERRLVDPTEQFDRLEPFLSTILDADPGLNFSEID